MTRLFVDEADFYKNLFLYTKMRNVAGLSHLFESAIDLLSYGTLKLLSSRDWRQENCLSLAGIYKPKNIIGESTLPAALMQYLKDFPQIKEIALHLDNDTAGRLAAKTIKTLLSPSHTISDEPPKRGKDMNDYLRIIFGKKIEREI